MSPPVFVVDTNVVVAGLVTGSNRSPVALVLDSIFSGRWSTCYRQRFSTSIARCC